MADVRDLDVVVPEPKRVKFGGAEYEVPADLPMEIFLRINQAQAYKTEDGDDDVVKQIESLTGTLSDLFVWQLEERGVAEDQRAKVHENVKRILMRRGTRYCFTLVQNIYKEDDVAAEAAAAESDPTQPPVPQAEDTNGTRSSST